MPKKTTRIPVFKSIKEEAEFWDTHDVTDFLDELTPVTAKVTLSQPKEETITLRIQATLKKQLSEIATEMGVNTSTLARMWIIEKIRQVGGV
jgi:predicted DNA binding CopG/RHH family protein